MQGEEGDTLFEYLVREDNAEWQHWRECVPSWKYPKEQERPKFAQLVIPTLDSVRYEKLLTLAYSVQKVCWLSACSHTCGNATLPLSSRRPCILPSHAAHTEPTATAIQAARQ